MSDEVQPGASYHELPKWLQHTIFNVFMIAFMCGMLTGIIVDKIFA